MTFRKIIGIFLIILSFSCAPTQGMTAAAGVAGAMALSSALAPIITPIALNVAKETRDQLPKVLELLSRNNQCKQTCMNLSRITCSTTKGTSFCKGRCQKMMKVGAGYTLKIRYTNDWTMQKCVAFATKKNKHAFKEGNVKSIAIYGKDDFELAIRIISQLAALDEFILLNGKIEGTQDNSPTELDQLVKQAKENSDRINKNFQKYVQENFGPQ